MPNLTRPQADFLNLVCPFPAFVGGYGSGKTWAGCSKICSSAWTDPGVPLGYFAPTQPDIKQIFFPTLDECAEDWGLTVSYRRGDLEADLFSGRQYRTTIICRSMRHPEQIKGFKVGRALADEIDTLPAEHAQDAWRKIIARRRYKFGGLGWIGVTTTPEGFKFTYDQWERKPREDPGLREKYQLVRAPTATNAKHLQDGYIEDLLATYPANLVEAYLNGEFVNMRAGRVYVNYDPGTPEKPGLNNSTETIQPGDVLHVGMDFNIGRMAAVVHVLRDGKPHAVEEIINAFDAPDIIRILKERYWIYIDGEYRQKHQIRVYPDSSGGSRTRVGAGINEIQLLKQAGFTVSAPNQNPPVRDRVVAMNAMFCNAQGERKYFVNRAGCPTYHDNLVQQPYDDKGEPDKKSGMDHAPDGAGYFIHKMFPVIRPVRNLRIGVAQ